MTAKVAAVQARIFLLLLPGFLPPGPLVCGSLPPGPLLSGPLLSGPLLSGPLACGYSPSGLLPPGSVFVEVAAGAPAGISPGPVPCTDPGSALRGAPGPSFLSEPGSSGSAGSIPSPRIQIWPGVHQVMRDPAKPGRAPASPLHSHSIRYNVAAAWRFHGC